MNLIYHDTDFVMASSDKGPKPLFRPNTWSPSMWPPSISSSFDIETLDWSTNVNPPIKINQLPPNPPKEEITIMALVSDVRDDFSAFKKLLIDKPSSSGKKAKWTWIARQRRGLLNILQHNRRYFQLFLDWKKKSLQYYQFEYFWNTGKLPLGCSPQVMLRNCTEFITVKTNSLICEALLVLLHLAGLRFDQCFSCSRSLYSNIYDTPFVWLSTHHPSSPFVQAALVCHERLDVKFRISPCSKTMPLPKFFALSFDVQCAIMRIRQNHLFDEWCQEQFKSCFSFYYHHCNFFDASISGDKTELVREALSYISCDGNEYRRFQGQLCHYSSNKKLKENGQSFAIYEQKRCAVLYYWSHVKSRLGAATKEIFIVQVPHMQECVVDYIWAQ